MNIPVMRVAILSDIHGSLQALEAVIADIRRTQPDVVLHGGDLVVNGPRPDEVATRVRELGWLGVVGNTDEMLWTLDALPDQLTRMPHFEPLLRVLYEHTAPAALQRLSDDNLSWLQSLPRQFSHDGIALVHASPNDLWRAPPPDAGDDQLIATYESLDTAVVVYGHIHRPFVRRLSGKTVANSGSVGLTWDGDPRASYLLIDEAEVRICRVEYPIEREVQDLLASSFPHARWLGEMRRLGKYLPPDNGP
jgi:putative phosphoesterase